LPWKDDPKEVDVQPSHSEVSMGASVSVKEIAIDVEDVKQMCNIASKQCTVNQTTIEVSPKALPSSSKQQADKLTSNCIQTKKMNDTDGYVKSHRNFPKIRDDDFLWS
jgi:hypothetical protein